MGLKNYIKTLRKNHVSREKNLNESGLLSDLRFRSDKTNDGSLPSRYHTDFGKPSLMDTYSWSEDSQQAVVPDESDNLGQVKLSRVEEDFVDWLNDDSSSSEARPVVPDESDNLGQVKLSRVEEDFVDWLNDDSSSSEARPVVPDESDNLGQVKLSRVEEDFVDWLNDDSSSSEARPSAMPTWAQSEATFQAWPDDLSQKFEPFPEANEERSDAVLSQTIEHLHKVHKKPSVDALSQTFEPLPDANEEQSDSVMLQTHDPLPDANEEQRDAVLSQTFEPLPDAREEQSVVSPQKSEPQSEASKEQSDDVESQKFEPLSETHAKPSVTGFSPNFMPLPNADQSEVVTLRQRLKEVSSLLPRTNEEEEEMEMEDDYLLFGAVETPDDYLLLTDEEPDDLPCKADKKQGRNILAPEEVPLLKADVISEDYLLDADEEARNTLHQVGEHHKKCPGHVEDNAISYEIDESDNSIVELGAGEGPRDSHLEDDEEPVDPLLGVVVESDHPRSADADDDEYFLVGVEEASDSRLGTDARECESLLDSDEDEDDSRLDNADDESLLDEYGDDSLLDAEGCPSLLKLDLNPSDSDSLAEFLDSGNEEEVRCRWCEDAVVKTTVKGLKGLANHFQRGSSLPYPEYLKEANQSAAGKIRGLQAAADDRETQGNELPRIPSQQHDQSDSQPKLLSGSHERDSTIKTIDSRESGSRSAASSSSIQTGADSAKAAPTPKGKDIAGETEKKATKAEKRIQKRHTEIIRMPENGDKPPEFRKTSTKRRPKTSVLDSDDASFHNIDEVRGVDKETNNADFRSDDMRPPKHGEEELSPPRSQSVLETREAPSAPMFFAPEPPPTTTSPPRRHGRRRTIVKVVCSGTTTSTDVHDFEEPQLPTLQQQEDSSSIKKDWTTIKGQPKPTYYWSEPLSPMRFYLSQPPPPPPPPRRISIVMMKPKRAIEKAVASEEAHHKRPETNSSSIEKRQDQRRPISRASLQLRDDHMDVKIDHATRKTSGRVVKSVPDHRRPDPPCDDRNDTFAGREEMCPMARMRFNSKRTQLV
jgi:hypothetical protein